MPYQRYNFDSAVNHSRTLKNIDVQLLYITRSRYDRQWQSVMHTHPFTELFYVVEGQGKFHIENDTYLVKSNDFIIINPNIMHTEANDGENSLEYIALGIEGLSFHAEGSHRQHYSMYNFKKYRDEMMFYMKSMIRELHKKEEGYQEICTNLLETLILLILRNTKSQFAAVSSDRVSRECTFIEQYIDEHFSENISLDTLSNLTYMNKYYMVHIFKKHKGIPPINYLIERRIAEAKYLLETTNYPVAKVAQAIGFSSQSYFSQVFRKELGMTPLQYRREKT